MPRGQPVFSAIETIADHCGPWSRSLLGTIGSARSRPWRASLPETRCLTEVDSPVVAAQYAGEALVVELALVLHADLASDRVGGGVGDGRERVDVVHLGIGASLR